MIHIKDHKTTDMIDPFPFLGPKRRQRPEVRGAAALEVLFHIWISLNPSDLHRIACVGKSGGAGMLPGNIRDQSQDI